MSRQHHKLHFSIQGMPGKTKRITKTAFDGKAAMNFKAKTPKQVVIFLRGGPAVGKSTICQALVEKIPLSARIEQDILRYMVAGGLVASRSNLAPSQYPEEYKYQCRLGDQNALVLARNFANAGFIPVIAGFNGGESAETFHLLKHPDEISWYPDSEILNRELPGIRNFQVVLDASPDTISERMKQRGWDGGTINFVLKQRQIFLKTVSTGQVDMILDTSDTSPQARIQ